ncbi:MAG: prepilin peptidase [Candidatus Colwellbacteria bacterium]|nr:prepilin peptidase [Candidatus Colwellbacteria bacterium]
MPLPILAIASSPSFVLNFLFLFFLGLAVGSFLNVVSIRYSPEKKLFHGIAGRSYCDHCGKTLSWYELIPLFSFLIQLGRCRSCHATLDLQYPLVEFLSGVIFTAVPVSFLANLDQSFYAMARVFYPWFEVTRRTLTGGLTEGWIMTILWILVFLTLLLIAVIDFRLKVIPDGLNIFLGVLAVTALATRYYFQDFGLIKGAVHDSFMGSYAVMFRFSDGLLINYLTGALLGVIFFGGLYFITRGCGIGFGDVKLALPLGLILGYPDIVLVSMISFILGAIVGVYFILIKKKGMKDSLPFGPFMVLGVTLVFFFGYDIVDVYFRLFKF